MRATLYRWSAGLLLAMPMLLASPNGVDGQGRGNSDRDRQPEAQSGVTLSVELQAQIRDFYTANPVVDVEALPPGQRRRLERGKALPPGIAKKVAPPELQSALSLPSGYEIVEVGLDVLLVEVATNIVHDVLMDIVR